MTVPQSSPNHYATLGLRFKPHAAPPSAGDIKTAYRAALLTHHPDKAPADVSSVDRRSLSRSVDVASNRACPTVDEITAAYRILSSPKLRREHDRQLILGIHNGHKDGWDEKDVFQTGLETVDLDEMGYDEQTGVWYRACRCGQERGFTVTEEELEREQRTGEVLVGCRGCSLWVKVVFGVEDAEEEENGKG